ncbi:MAG TPA: CPBP family intramembrane glutamic endopeptidase, partial [Bdellovibrionota bacterium]|nr:CPBP family intramembrane glutamic endopeptidase [Bdellovibrionota bacterium]
QAFKSHPLLWRIWSPQAASTGRVLQGTLVGYILLGFDLLFVVGFYSIALGRWGWWVPSESLFDPDLLSTPLPWLGPVSQALFAGSVEESVFRAIPLAWAGILGDRVGRRRTFIGIALVIQIFVFAAGHATYPGVPSYSRLVELILPSVIFAALYLRWGLFTSVICHFTYDLTLMSSPIFVAHTPGIWLHRVPVILAGIVPLLAIVRGRARAGKWLALPASLTNASWKAPATAGRSARPPKAADRLKGLTTPIVLFAAALMLTLVALFLKPLRSDIPPLNLNRAQAIQTARAALEASQIHLGPEWTPEATLAQRDADRIPLVRRNESEASVRSLMKDRFLTPPTWAVRFLRWNAEVVDRGEEYQVVMTADGARTRIRHILPERAPGKTLTQAEARKLALKAAMDRMGLPQAELQEVVTSSENRPARTDWRVEYKVPTANLKTAQARVRVGISGDQVTEVHPYVHVPEQWERAERARRMPMDLLSMACSGGLFVLFVLLVAPALLDRTRKGLDRVTFWTVVSGVFAVAMVHLYNRLPAVAAEFSTDAPFNHHLSRALLSNVLAGAALALIFALVMTRIWIRSELGARSAVRPAAWAVAACGLVMAAFNHLARAKSEAALDMLNGIESATSRFAALSAPRELVLFLLIGGVLALALRNLTQWTSTRDNPGAWNIAALVAWTVFSVGVSRFDTVTEALIAAVGICAGSAAAYVLGLRRDPTLVLFFLAPFRFVTLLEVWRMPAHPGSRVSTAVTGLMLLVLLWLAWQGMYKTSTAKAK